MAAPFTTISTKGMSRERWLAERTKGIGGSDAANILGVGPSPDSPPYKSVAEVWAEKIEDGLMPEDLSGNDRVAMGTMMEDRIAQMYSSRTGTQVRNRFAILVSKKVPYLRANVDRLTTGHPDGRGIVECKASWAPQIWCDGLPDNVALQAQHYLIVTEYDFVDVAAFFGEFQCFRVWPDPELQAAMLDAYAEFWAHVTNRTVPPLTGHSGEGKVLRHVFPGDKGLAVLDMSTEEGVELVQEYLDGKDQEAAGKARKDAAASLLKALMGDHTKAKCGTIPIAWSRFDTRRIDSKALKDDHPDVWEKYAKPCPSDRLTVTPPK
jgi:putative phage-type endonuclease